MALKGVCSHYACSNAFQQYSSHVSADRYNHIKIKGRLETTGKFSAIFYKGDNFCGFPFTIVHPNPLLKSFPIYSEMPIFAAMDGEQFFSF